jgi:hypothetical protein
VPVPLVVATYQLREKGRVRTLPMVKFDDMIAVYVIWLLAPATVSVSIPVGILVIDGRREWHSLAL